MPYFVTYSGVKIDIECISEHEISIPDIAHHLTKVCRYGGALDLDTHYSVASHSLNLVYWVYNHEEYLLKEGVNTYELRRAALMHDATEAYLGDIVTGLKKHLPEYRAIEDRIHEIMVFKYNLSIDPDILEIVKELDTRILLDETLALSPHHFKHVKRQHRMLSPLGIEIDSDKNLQMVKNTFLRMCDSLDIKD